MTRRSGSLAELPGQLALPLPPALPDQLRYALARRIAPGWHQRSECAGTSDPDAFYPDDATGNNVRRLVGATDLCAFCPVARSCLATALVRDELGVWGRTTEADRDALVTELIAGGDVDAVLDKAVLGPMAELTTTTKQWRQTA